MIPCSFFIHETTREHTKKTLVQIREFSWTKINIHKTTREHTKKTLVQIREISWTKINIQKPHENTQKNISADS